MWERLNTYQCTAVDTKCDVKHAYARDGSFLVWVIEPCSSCPPQVFFSGNVEALCFVTPVDSATREPWLIISVRGLPHLVRHT